MDPVNTRETFTPDANMGVTELDDGSAMVDMPTQAVPQVDFFSNLAESLDVFTLNQLSSDLLDLIEKDKDARKKRDEQYEEGLRRTGLGDDAPGGALFDGASRAVHPVLAEGCVDFAARTIKELFPSNGPVKTKIQGEANEPRLMKAKAKRDFLNWYLTEKMEEYRAEKEIMLTQLPLGGSQYEKYWFDPAQGRVVMEFVPVDKVLLPYSAASFYTSPRITQMQDVTKAKFEERIRTKFYKDIENITLEDTPEETSAEKANDRIEGKTESGYNEDGIRLVYEISCVWELKDGGERPYVVHLDDSTNKVVAIYRNWSPEDQLGRREDWWVEDKFIPWRGAYGIGLPHLIGSLAGALTGALRALLDSAHINNSPGAVKLKGGRTSGQNTQVAQTEIKEIDAPAGVDDVRKVIMPMPFNPPSAVLFQLLDWITAQAKGVVATAEEKIADANSQMPVGTALALIEQGSQVFSSIHSRLHESQRRGFKIICRLIAQNPEAHATDLQRFGLAPQDMLDLDGIDPVSDPHIFSESQRFAQFQAAMQLAQQLAQSGVQTNMLELGRRGYELLRIDGVDTILPKPPEPVSADPVTENIVAAENKPVKATPQQDHMAHAFVHLQYIISGPHVLSNAPMPGLGILLNHVIADHLNLLYKQTVESMATQAAEQAAMNGEPINQDQLAARCAMQAQQKLQPSFQELAQLIQQANQVVQQKTPQPQVDPAVQKTFEAAMADIERKKQETMAKLEFDTKKFAAEQQDAQQRQQVEMAMKAQQQQIDARMAEMGNIFKMQIAQMQEEGKRATEQIRQQVEMMKNDRDNEQHQMTELLKNRDDNQTQLMIAQMKEQLAAMQPAEAPKQDDSMLREMQGLLNEIRTAKTDDALAATLEGLRAVIEGQQNHQQRTMEMAQQLLRAE